MNPQDPNSQLKPEVQAPDPSQGQVIAIDLNGPAKATPTGLWGRILSLFNKISAHPKIAIPIVILLLLLTSLLAGVIVGRTPGSPTNSGTNQENTDDINKLVAGKSTKSAETSTSTTGTKTTNSGSTNNTSSGVPVVSAPSPRTPSVVPAPPPPSPKDAECDSATYRKADGSFWKCTFADSFNGTQLDRSKWLVSQSKYSGASQGLTCGFDDGKNVVVSGGVLSLSVRQEASTFTCESPLGNFQTKYTGGSISTRGKFEQIYGRYEFRAKMPTAKVIGVHSALWLNPMKQIYGRWPASGEIDVTEFYTKYPDRGIPYIHYYQKPSSDAVTSVKCYIQNPSDFHTYLLEWTQTSITISYDGKLCLSHRINPTTPLSLPAPFNHPFAIHLTQTLGTGQNAFDPAKTPLPQSMQIDWVRVWK